MAALIKDIIGREKLFGKNPRLLTALDEDGRVPKSLAFAGIWNDGADENGDTFWQFFRKTIQIRDLIFDDRHPLEQIDRVIAEQARLRKHYEITAPFTRA